MRRTKDHSQRQVPYLRMQRLDSDPWRGRLSLRLRTETDRGSLKKLAAPLRDLNQVDIELLGQFGNHLLALHDYQCHRVEARPTDFAA